MAYLSESSNVASRDACCVGRGTASDSGPRIILSQESGLRKTRSAGTASTRFMMCAFVQKTQSTPMRIVLAYILIGNGMSEDA